MDSFRQVVAGLIQGRGVLPIEIPGVDFPWVLYEYDQHGGEGSTGEDEWCDRKGEGRSAQKRGKGRRG